MLRGGGVEDDFYVPPSPSYASSGPVAAAAEPDADSVTDYRTVALFPQPPSTTSFTASQYPGSLHPSYGSEHHLLTTNYPWTALLAATGGPSDIDWRP